MRRRAIVVALLMAVTLALAGCGSSSNNASGTTNGTSTTSTSQQLTCPTDNTKAFPKTRFVADVGLIAGTFHRWIWKPYQAGTFKKGASGHLKAIIKATAAAALIVHLTKNAVSNVKADPTLCNAIGAPLSDLAGKFDSLGSDIRSGNLGSILGLNTAIGSVTGLMAKHGSPVTETSQG